MNLDKFAVYIPYIISAVALFFALRKQKHEEASIDAKTIQTFVDTTATVGKQYKDLLNNFELYKEETEKKIDKLRKEVAIITNKNTVLTASLAAEISARQNIEKELTTVKNDNSLLKSINIEQAKEIKKLTRWVKELCNQLKDNNITPVSCIE